MNKYLNIIDKRLEEILRDIKENSDGIESRTGLLGTKLDLYVVNIDGYVVCDFCGKETRVYVFDETTGKVWCLDCITKAFENFLEFLKKLGEKLESPNKTDGRNE